MIYDRDISGGIGWGGGGGGVGGGGGGVGGGGVGERQLHTHALLTNNVLFKPNSLSNNGYCLIMVTGRETYTNTQIHSEYMSKSVTFELWCNNRSVASFIKYAYFYTGTNQSWLDLWNNCCIASLLHKFNAIYYVLVENYKQTRSLPKHVITSAIHILLYWYMCAFCLYTC